MAPNIQQAVEIDCNASRSGRVCQPLHPFVSPPLEWIRKQSMAPFAAKHLHPFAKSAAAKLRMTPSTKDTPKQALGIDLSQCDTLPKQGSLHHIFLCGYKRHLRALLPVSNKFNAVGSFSNNAKPFGRIWKNVPGLGSTKAVAPLGQKGKHGYLLK